jgi:hypothetical protein
MFDGTINTKMIHNRADLLVFYDNIFVGLL